MIFFARTIRASVDCEIASRCATSLPVSIPRAVAAACGVIAILTCLPVFGMSGARIDRVAAVVIDYATFRFVSVSRQRRAKLPSAVMRIW